MGTKNNPGPFDCYANADPDETMFILLARDKHAPTLVWLWAVLRELDGESPEKVTEARNCAISMMAWAHEHDRKVVGLGQATLAGVFEMIHAVNHLAKEQRAAGVPAATNEQTTVDLLRLYLSETQFEPVEQAFGATDHV